MNPDADDPRLRKIDTRDFRVATRATQREVNRQIVLALIREHQPISRVELARRMNVWRGAITPLVRELVESGIVAEQGTAASARGRRPMLLRVRTSDRYAVAVDVRRTHTTIALTDFGGVELARDTFDTSATPGALVAALAPRIAALVDRHAGGPAAACQGIGVVVPGMVDRRSGRVLYAPQLGWRDVDLQGELARLTGLGVQVESAPIACALARLWLAPQESRRTRSFAYVSVSDGVGVGLVTSGETIRGEAHTAGEFGHVSLDPNGPPCVCGQRGCWEAFACNAATVERYAALAGGATTRPRRGRRAASLTVDEVVRRALLSEPDAIDAVVETGRQIGRGLAAVVSAFNPGCIYVGGEITAAWRLIERPIRQALAAGTITSAAQSTPVVADGSPADHRLLGAVALVAAPSFAATSVG